MTLPKPIRYDVDTWLVMRNDPILPKAIIRRFVHTETGREYYRVVTWDLESKKRNLIGRYPSLEDANVAVLYDAPQAQNGIYAGAPNGRR
jgi:hypothetical protein